MMDKVWRYGDTNHVNAAVESETVIEIGDLLWQDDGHARPAGDMGGYADESWSASSERFCRRFLGVAMQESRAGETDPIRVATTGVFEIEVRYDRRGFELGDMVGPCISLNARFFNRQVARVGSAGLAIGRVAKRAARPATSILVDIRSAVMTGGVVQSAQPSKPSGVKRLMLDVGDVLVWEIDRCLSPEEVEQMAKELQVIAPHNRVAVLPVGRLVVVDPPHLEPHKFDEVDNGQ